MRDASNEGRTAETYVDLLSLLSDEQRVRFQALTHDEKGFVRALAEMYRDLDSEIRGAEAISRELRGMSFRKRNRAALRWAIETILETEVEDS